MSTKCSWCGREFDDSKGYLGGGLFQNFCSRRCYEEYEANRKAKDQELEERARQYQESLDREARSMGYANHAEYRAAKNQELRDSVDAEADELLAQGRNVSAKLSAFGNKSAEEALESNNLKRLATALSAVSENDSKSFGEEEKAFIWIDQDGKLNFLKGEGFTESEARFLFDTYFFLVKIHHSTQKIKKENQDIKVSRTVEYTSGASMYTNEALEFLMQSNSQNIEDVLKPLLEKAEKKSVSSENLSTIISFCIAIAAAFISVLILNASSGAGGSFWGGLFAYAALCSTIISTGFRRKNVANLVITFVLPAALYFISGMLRTQHFYSSFMFKMSLLASLLAIIPAVKNFRKTKFSLDTKLSEADKKFGYYDLTLRTGSVIVSLGLIAILFIIIANFFSINFGSGAFENADDEMGAFFWTALFLLASLLAPGYSFAMPKSIHNRPSANIVLIIEAIAFGYFSLPYFQGGHYVTAVIGLIGAIMSVIGLAKSFISKK